MVVVNLHRVDRRNPGDLYASPLHYFDVGGRCVDIATPPEKINCDLLIVGGGGIVSHRGVWKTWLDNWMAAIQSKKAVIWGAAVSPKMHKEAVFSRFVLVGARNSDAGPACRFVPCASCLHPAFDDAPAGKGVGIVSHNNRIIPGAELVNSPNDFDTVVNYIKSKSAIVTSSYHVAYWSQLLGRAIYIWDSPTFQKPLAGKMYTFDEPIPHITDLAEAKAAPLDPRREARLDRYREINRRFAKEVFAAVNE